MTKQISSHQLTGGRNEVSLPRGSRVLGVVSNLLGTLTLVALGDQANKSDKRVLHVRTVGEFIPDEHDHFKLVGIIQTQSTIVAVFEEGAV